MEPVFTICSGPVAENGNELILSGSVELWKELAAYGRGERTAAHSVRVAMLAGGFALSRGVPLADAENLGAAALLHDIGKMHPDFWALLDPNREKGRPTPAELEIIHTHPQHGVDRVEQAVQSGRLLLFPGLTEVLAQHHENFDGSGYPLGLAGDAIDPGAQIVAIADTTDAMLDPTRAYIDPLPIPVMLERIRSQSGIRFDPELVTAYTNYLQQLIASGDFDYVLQCPLSGQNGAFHRAFPAFARTYDFLEAGQM